MIRSTIIFAVALSLAACGSKQIGQGASLSDGVKNAVATRLGKGAKPEPSAPFTGPVISVSMGSLGIRERAVLIADQDGYKTYQSKARRSYTFKGGQLTATRGLANDLMSRDATGDQRAYRFLTSNNGLGALTVTCDVGEQKTETIKLGDQELSARLTEEICRSPAASFKTRVWRDGSGPRKAQQWVGPRSGFATIYWVN